MFRPLRILSAVILLFGSATVFSQNTDSLQWQPHAIDENVSLDIPIVSYAIKDSLGVYTLQATLNGATISLQVKEFPSDNNLHIDDDDQLRNFYSGAVDGIVAAWGGSELKSKSVELKGLTTQEFNYRLLNGDVAVACQGWLFLAKKKLYIVQMYYEEYLEEEFNPVRQRLFTSIEVSGEITNEDQLPYAMTDGNRANFATGQKIGRVAKPVTIGLLIIAVGLYGYLFYESRNRTTSPAITVTANVFHGVRQLLVFLLLAYGGVTLFAALMNWISENGYPVGWYVILGSLGFAAAFGLAKLKIPMAKVE